VNLRFSDALWARVFTPTSGVSDQCTSRVSSPAIDAPPPSPVLGIRRRLLREHRQAERMPLTCDRAVHRLHRAAATAAVAQALTLAGSGATAAGFDPPGAMLRSRGVAFGELGWVWPATGFRVTRTYVAPAHEYGPGHRGIDLDLLGGSELRAPADGMIAFAGGVAGRGILTIDHGGGLVTTLEPVDSDLLPGARVARGERVATLALGGHAVAGAVHFGVRLNGDYINPMLLLGGVPRAVLLPCCD
jgi:murein DD-endopeptidase MepM/ murein hydrolase activator NlpD